ncbi:MAG TPA: hypothetical protein VHB23_00485 [Devosiaceae bacterium]|nr:hypothetical protein [Devosiaceae bacterium]
MRNIISSPAFDAAVELLGGYRAIDAAMAPVIEALASNPYGFPLFESDQFSFRWLITHEIAWVPPLVIVFRIDEDKNVILEHVEEAPDA